MDDKGSGTDEGRGNSVTVRLTLLPCGQVANSIRPSGSAAFD